MSRKVAVQCQCMNKVLQDISRESLELEDGIIDVKRIFSSEYNLARKDQLLSPRRSTSEPNIQYSVDYDDLCGPWPSPDHPTYKQYDDVLLKPMLCTWKFITIEDMKCMRQHLFDKNAIKSIIERKLPDDNVLFKGKNNKEIFLSFAWEIFKYMRDDGFSGKGISSILGLFYFTHRFFLSNSWRSAHETYAFFKDGLELHSVLNPPESDMIFNFSECDKLLDMFRSLYIQKLELVRLVYIPNYKLIFKLRKHNMEYSKESLVLQNSRMQI
ncbi:PREDICTED: uncharacterized protein LOC105368669 [Ceratosolen solmsi marchali]|uniref:Uncharacterized protein LOC105368669 n=1 Tax=Ceratosolen solmsi marchali TaxID=326594 RepID=A0AAJ6YX54_9HYME|nr:PREDICTED: uncharacterized protein LOC105368669 [Ceratosolen solmsi marchali]